MKSLLAVFSIAALSMIALGYEARSARAQKLPSTAPANDARIRQLEQKVNELQATVSALRASTSSLQASTSALQGVVQIAANRDVTIKAPMKLTLTSGTMLTVSASSVNVNGSATVAVKGGMVSLN